MPVEVESKTEDKPKSREEVLEEREANRRKKMAAVQQRIDERRDELDKCLDADYAAQVEARKPIFEYRVSCNVPVMEKGKRTSKKMEETVRGKNEDDAWAHFCDFVQHWPSPRGCGRKIVKLTKGKTP